MSLLETVQEKVPIQKGWSGDQKYCAVLESGEKYLLRISDISRKMRVQEGYAQMKRVQQLGIPMCAPVEFGICSEGVYVLHRWVDGVDAETELPRLPNPKQYAYGLDAGRILRKIHSLPAPAGALDWERRFGQKMERKVAGYLVCPEKYENGHLFLRFIEENKGVIKNRPQSYHHGDYHLGNMMIDKAGALTVIDFDRDDYGDPWEEFNRIVWSVQASELFACGMVDGYFDGRVPMEFWRLLALYISSNTLSSLPWAIPFGEKQIQVMRDQAAQVLKWYNNMECVIPVWYHSKENVQF